MEKLEIKESKISGKGVFAIKEIKKFDTICFMTGEEITLSEMLKRVDENYLEGSDPLGIGNEKYIHLDEFPRTINHSCNPNAFIKGKNELIALQDIESGEEITYDYSTTMNDNEQKIIDSDSELWTCECKCDSEHCRGIIDQFKTLPIERQTYYVENSFAPDFILKDFQKAILLKLLKE